MWLSLVFSAFALDAHGFYPAVSDNDLADPLSLWRAETQVPGSWSLQILGEYADEALMRAEVTPEGEIIEFAVVDNLKVLNLGFSYAIHPRVTASVALPLALGWYTDELLYASPSAIGDARFSVPVTLLMPGSERGIGVSAVPFLGVPVAGGNNFSSGYSGGAVAAATWSKGDWAANANLGLWLRPAEETFNLHGGPALPMGLSGSWRFHPSYAVHLETVLTPDLQANEIPLRGAPGEVRATLRGRYERGWSLSAGGAAAITPGASAAEWRLLAGAGYTHKKSMGGDRDGDGIVDVADACPTEPETFNELGDKDGCPDAWGRMQVTVRDGDGKPVAYAKVKMTDEVAEADMAGIATFTHLQPGSRPDVTVEGTGFRTWSQRRPTEIGEGDNPPLEVTLQWRTGGLKVTVVDAAGKPVDAAVTLRGPRSFPAVRVGSDGVEEIAGLYAVDWDVVASAPKLGTDRQRVTIVADQTAELKLSLGRELAELRGGEVVILEQIQFEFGKAALTPASRPIIAQVANVLLLHPELLKVEVQGHTDAVDDDAFNLQLSQERAAAVVAALVESGVEPERLLAVGYGETRPIAPNDNESGRALNRRVQFVIRVTQ